jgi:hypothetical protein
MWKAALAGAFALVTIGPLSVTHHGIVTSSAFAQDIVIREADIERLKQALRSALAAGRGRIACLRATTISSRLG